MLPLPYFFYSNGIILTLAIFLICGASTYYTLKILISFAYENQIYDNPILLEEYYGIKMAIFCITLLLINSFGSIISWNVFIAKFSKDILNYFNPALSTKINVIYILISIPFFIQIPLSQLMKDRSFSIFSFIGISHIIYVIIILFIEFPKYASENFTMERMTKLETYVYINHKLIDMPFVFFFAFGNHSTILSAINEIKDKTDKRVHNAGRRTFYAEVFIYIAVFFVRYFSTYENTNLSLLKLIGEIFMTILMIVNIELYLFTTIPTLELILNDNKKFSKKQTLVSSFTVLTILIFISFYIERVISILSLIGIIAQVGLIFILPIVLYIKSKESELSIFEKVKFILFIIFFTFLGLAGFILNLSTQFFKLFK